MANSIISEEHYHEGTPCWDWAGKLDQSKNNGAFYGRLNIRIDGEHKTVRAHRASFEAFTGKKIRKGFEIDHKCNREICIATLHLQEVTPKKNCREREKRKNRAVEDCGQPQGVTRAATDNCCDEQRI